VTGPDQAVLSKKNFRVHIELPANGKRAAVTDHFEETIDTGGRPAGDLTINLGLQQSPEAVEFYRNTRVRELGLICPFRIYRSIASLR